MPYSVKLPSQADNDMAGRVTAWILNNDPAERVWG